MRQADDGVKFLLMAQQTLEQLRSITDPAERARAVGPYLELAERKMVDARKLRRDAIAEHLKANPADGPTAVARACGVSVTLVKNVRDGKV